jgi:outer membrane lipoprotein-sorting protein
MKRWNKTILGLMAVSLTFFIGQRTSATVTVNPRPTATISGDATICAGQPATIQATLTGTGPWRVTWSDGITQNNVTVNPVTRLAIPVSTTIYTVTAVSDSNCGAGTSSGSATVTVNSAPGIITQPTAQTVCAGQSASFTAAASGSPAPTVQWKVSTDGGETFTDIDGATDSTLTFTTSVSDTGTEYRAMFSNTCGSAGCIPATLTIATSPSITSQPTNQLAYPGQSVNFSVTASGSSLGYQWRKDSTNLINSGNVSGATSNTLTLSNVTTNDDNSSYDVVVSNGCGSVTSSVATLGVSTLNDGIPDWWKILYGFPLNDPTVASADPDGDGYSNLQEYRCGTSPVDSNSHCSFPSNLAGWWNLDDGIGTNAVDSSLNRRDLTLMGGTSPVWTNIALEGGSYALQFDGQQNFAQGLITGVTFTQVTIVAWVNTSAAGTGTNPCAVSMIHDDNPGDTPSGDLLVWDNAIGAAGQTTMATTNIIVHDSNWHQLASVQDGSSVRLYLDGSMAASAPDTVTNITANCYLRLAYRNTDGGSYFNGIVDNVRLYNRALSDAEITAIYNVDTDNDGIPDVWEINHGLNPNDDSDATQTSSNAWAHGLTNLQVYQNPSILIADNYSTQNDGIPDWWKVKHGFGLTDPTVTGTDTDGDGYTNLQEYQCNTDPHDQNSYPTILLIPNAWAVYTNGSIVQITATILSTNASVTVSNAEWFLDSITGVTNGTGFAMSAADGTFDSTNEVATATFTPAFPYGERHELWVHARGSDTQWCPFKKIIINPNVDDILDKIQANYSAFQDLQYEVTMVQTVNGVVGYTKTATVKMKGPYMVHTEYDTGDVTIQNENRFWSYNNSLGIGDVVMTLGLDGDFSVINSRQSDFFWDVPLCKTRTNAAITNSVNSASFDVSLTSTPGKNWPAESFSCDHTKGVVGTNECRGGDMVLRSEYLNPIEVISGHWLFSQHRHTMQFDSGDQIVLETTISNIVANQGLPDSLFNIPTE